MVRWLIGWLSISFGVSGPGCCILRHLSVMPAVKSSRVDDGEMKLRLSEVSGGKRSELWN